MVRVLVGLYKYLRGGRAGLGPRLYIELPVGTLDTVLF